MKTSILSPEALLSTPVPSAGLRVHIQGSGTIPVPSEGSDNLLEAIGFALMFLSRLPQPIITDITFARRVTVIEWVPKDGQITVKVF